MTYPCAHECGDTVEWHITAWSHSNGDIYCDMGGESYVTAWPAEFPEPNALREPVSTEGAADDAEVMTLWRQAGLPEYFLGNGGTNRKLVDFANLLRKPSAKERNDDRT